MHAKSFLYRYIFNVQRFSESWHSLGSLSIDALTKKVAIELPSGELADLVVMFGGTSLY